MSGHVHVDWHRPRGPWHFLRFALLFGIVVLGLLPLTLLHAASPSLSVVPSPGFSGSAATLTGSSWDPKLGEVDVFWDTVGGTLLGQITPTQNGDINKQITIPLKSDPGDYLIHACQSYGTKSQVCVNAKFLIPPSPTATPTNTPTIAPTAAPTATPTDTPTATSTSPRT